MTKKEIFKAISEELSMTQLQTKEVVQRTFDHIVETLVRDGRIELRNFGVFEVKTRAPRKARNPRTGEKVFVPAKNVVTFKPGKEMEDRIRDLSGSFAPLEEEQTEQTPPSQPSAATPAGPAHTASPALGVEPANPQPSTPASGVGGTD